MLPRTAVPQSVWLQPATYDEVVEERAVQRVCGYPLCNRSVQIQVSVVRTAGAGAHTTR